MNDCIFPIEIFARGDIIKGKSFLDVSFESRPAVALTL